MYSEKEKELLRFFGFEYYITDSSVAAPKVYSMMAEKAFCKNMQGPEVEALRKCCNALMAGGSFRGSPTWEAYLDF